jgi:hypothetical protein
MSHRFGITSRRKCEKKSVKEDGKMEEEKGINNKLVG